MLKEVNNRLQAGGEFTTERAHSLGTLCAMETVQTAIQFETPISGP